MAVEPEVKTWAIALDVAAEPATAASSEALVALEAAREAMGQMVALVPLDAMATVATV